ncbi:hypothetical protein Tco_0926715 [Tanacetum coccineum]|uniref:Uncharacterized protein n=1 Tax=Tanacetum coccineum TaxID=301880 RepID=A0ABQ5DAL6_9ASTR
MTIAEYMEYEAEMKRQSWRNARSYFLTKYEDTNINSFHHNKSRVLDYPHHFDDSKINAYYDLPPLLCCFKPVQPHTEYRCEPLEEDTDYISVDESRTGKEGMINHTDSDKPFTPKPQPKDEELSFDEDVDDWLKTKMEKHMCGGCLLLRMMTFKMKKGSFQEPYRANLGTSVNVLPKSMFVYLKLANLKETDMVVEMANMTKKASLGIVENILIDIFNREISLAIRKEKVLFDMDGGVYHSKIPVEKVYMANFVQEEEYFNPLKIEDDVFSYESFVYLLFEQCTRSFDNESIDTLDSVDNMQELEVKHEDMVGYDAIYGKGENGMLEQWMCFWDHERQSVGGNYMIFADLFKVRYGNKSIDDTTCERRHYEWVA